ncbi:hypothetical protein [Leucothrix pacifica]|uniref:Lipoprotein n=1 Tax=Leucothrix pacifica TaxID=1247513 RepID=A0A317C2R3_9GAMM|nr:hypothetical protein [Leucothrix pacifica]PWQ92925.1 hypothetical protein DKW60_18625 [Leucothrix pacifica]
MSRVLSRPIIVISLCFFLSACSQKETLFSELVSKKVDQTLLNQHKSNGQAEFRHVPHQGTPVAYGRVDYDTLSYQEQSYPLTFLSYNLVFAHSGLLKGLAGWQRVAMGVVGSNQDWHQLDHYVGLTVVLYQNQPLAVLLQQHNYQTVWLLDRATDAESEIEGNKNTTSVINRSTLVSDLPKHASAKTNR